MLAITLLRRSSAAAAAGAQTYPTRPIQVIVPFAGGSASDVVTRILLDRTSKSLGQPFVVDNRREQAATPAPLRRPGRARRLHLGGDRLRPGGRQQGALSDLGYDPQKDFEPISLFAVFPIVIVASTKLPVKTLNELVAYAMEHPTSSITARSASAARSILRGYFEQLTGAKLTHVPYRNIAQYAPDLIAGTVPLGFQWLPNVLGAAHSGGAKAIAVANDKRMAALPDVPTTAEAGIQNYIIPAGSCCWRRKERRAVITKLNEEVTAALTDPALRDRFIEQGAQAVIMTPDELAKFMSAEAAKWSEIITKAEIPQIQ